jgi:hypothetical protein
VTDLLRSHYAAPQDETYWNSLEARVMLSVTRGLGRISDLRSAWWSGFGEFRTADIRNAGLIAATIALVVAGATFVREAELAANARAMAQRAAVESAAAEAAAASAAAAAAVDQTQQSVSPAHAASKPGTKGFVCEPVF